MCEHCETTDALLIIGIGKIEAIKESEWKRANPFIELRFDVENAQIDLRLLDTNGIINEIDESININVCPFCERNIRDVKK